MKKITILAFLILLCTYSFNQLQSQDYLQIAFHGHSSIPTANVQGDSIILTSSDPNLTTLFNNYKIKSFTKEYPSASNLNTIDTVVYNNVYKVTVLTSLTTLASDIVALNSSKVDSIFLMDNPQLFYSPKNYNNCYNGIKWACAFMPLDLVGAKVAWGYTRGINCIKVGISDTWFVHHNDIDSKVFNLNNLPQGVIVYPANNPPQNPNGPHGTHVAGFVTSSKTANQLDGIPSLASGVQVGYFPMSVDGAILAVGSGCKVVNMSWGGKFYSGLDQRLLTHLYLLGTTLVAAAGNGDKIGTSGWDAESYYYPASYDHVISVTAIGSQWEVGNFSQPGSWKDCHRKYFGSTSDIDSDGVPKYDKTYQHNDKVDMCAPGYYVTSLGPYNSYDLMEGTSQSAPQVAAVAAMLYSLNPNFTPDEVEDYLKDYAVNIYGVYDNSTWNGKLGAGRLNAGGSIQAASINSCMASFSDILWKYDDRGLVELPSNKDFYDHRFEDVTFSTSTAPAVGSTVEWEFRYNGYSVFKTGFTASINWSIDFQNLTSHYTSGRVPDYCMNEFEVYVRQTTGACCYSAYKKEDASHYECIMMSPDLLEEQEIQKPLVKFKAYPNPSHSVLNISVDDKLLKNSPSYQILDVMGRIVAFGKITLPINKVDIINLSPGNYFLRIDNSILKITKN